MSSAVSFLSRRRCAVSRFVYFAAVDGGVSLVARSLTESDVDNNKRIIMVQKLLKWLAVRKLGDGARAAKGTVK